MDYADIINKLKNRVLNIVVIVVFLVIAQKIYLANTKKLNELKETQANELKKNQVMQDISVKEKQFNAYKNFINSKDSSSIINTIGSLAKDASVKINSIRPQDVTSYTIYNKYRYDLVITAPGYHEIAVFIGNLEEAKALFTVDSFSVRNIAGPEDESTQLQANLTVSTILLKE